MAGQGNACTHHILRNGIGLHRKVMKRRSAPDRTGAKASTRTFLKGNQPGMVSWTRGAGSLRSRPLPSCSTRLRMQGAVALNLFVRLQALRISWSRLGHGRPSPLYAETVITCRLEAPIFVAQSHGRRRHELRANRSERRTSRWEHAGQAGSPCRFQVNRPWLCEWPGSRMRETFA